MVNHQPQREGTRLSHHLIKQRPAGLPVPTLQDERSCLGIQIFRVEHQAVHIKGHGPDVEGRLHRLVYPRARDSLGAKPGFGHFGFGFPTRVTKHPLRHAPVIHVAVMGRLPIGLRPTSPQTE